MATPTTQTNPKADVTLLAWRGRMGYTQEEAAHHLGAPVARYRAWEHTGKAPKYIFLACAALALGIDPFAEAGDKPKDEGLN